MANTLTVSFVLLTIVTVTLARFERVSDRDEAYRNLCPNNVRNANVPVKDPCDLKHYVMCYKGKPIYKMSCPTSTPYFESESQQCRLQTDVSVPPHCGVEKMPETCAEGADFMANATTCRWYIACIGQQEIPMQCQEDFYFITGPNRCMAYVLHYAKAIPEEKLEHCKDLDRKNGYTPKPTPRYTRRPVV